MPRQLINAMDSNPESNAMLLTGVADVLKFFAPACPLTDNQQKKKERPKKGLMSMPE